MRASEDRRGFTLVELLVVIGIIGILIALLLPAIQAVREAARLSTCSNNLKQLGVALHGFHNSRRNFPPSATRPGGAHENWAIKILPFLELKALSEQFDHDRPISDPVNEQARSTHLAVMSCPSDTYNREPFDGSGHGPTASFNDNWARGNYGANGALWFRGGASSPGWRSRSRRGVMGVGCSVPIRRIGDGASHTILLAEIRAGICSQDERGTWALSNAASSLWGHGGVAGDAHGPNAKQMNSDDSLGCSRAHAAVGGGEALMNMGMGCYPMDLGSSQQGARSLHTGGVNACFADGSVHFIDDEIESKPSSDQNLSVWDRMNASCDGQPLKEGSF